VTHVHAVEGLNVDVRLGAVARVAATPQCLADPDGNLVELFTPAR
jgi:hypothetical protein